jgi:hypothetical protein
MILLEIKSYYKKACGNEDVCGNENVCGNEVLILRQTDGISVIYLTGAVINMQDQSNVIFRCYQNCFSSAATWKDSKVFKLPSRLVHKAIKTYSSPIISV